MKLFEIVCEGVQVCVLVSEEVVEGVKVCEIVFVSV